MYAFFAQLTNPYTLFCVLLALGLINLWRKKGTESRGRLLLVTVPFLGLFVTSMPIVAYFLLGTLEWTYPPGEDRPSDAEAIVILNAGIKYADSVRPRAELDFDTIGRCLRAAELYHQGPPCPVVVTGGPEFRNGPGPSCAEVMRDFLVKLNVHAADIVVEPTSRTTFENAVECRKELEKNKLKKVMLVTDASHMLRSELCFLKQGIDVVPRACRHDATALGYTVDWFLPSPGAAAASNRVVHEWLGMAWYWLHGRI